MNSPCSGAVLEITLCNMDKVKILEVQLIPVLFQYYSSIIPVLKGDDKQDHKTHVKQEIWL